MSHDPDQNVRYPLTWPFWLAEKVAEAASARAMSVATWLREAAIEKLERTKQAATLERAALQDPDVISAVAEAKTGDRANLRHRPAPGAPSA